MSTLATNPTLQTQPNTGPNTNTNTDTDTDLTTSLLSRPKQPTTTNPSASNTTNPDPSHGAARAMSHTGAWKPALDRRQSWDAQEYKHDLLKRQYMGGGEAGGQQGQQGQQGKAGFSEV